MPPAQECRLYLSGLRTGDYLVAWDWISAGAGVVALGLAAADSELPPPHNGGASHFCCWCDPHLWILIIIVFSSMLDTGSGMCGGARGYQIGTIVT